MDPYLRHGKPRVFDSMHFQFVCNSQVLFDHGLFPQQEDVVQVNVSHHFQLLFLFHAVHFHLIDQMAHWNVHQETAILVIHS